jgi:tetratricopeptide (TPR) repeat protein
LAEEARARAEVRATDAEDALKKGRLVSAVLRSANVELGEARKALERAFYSSRTEEEKRAEGDRVWERVEVYERNVPKDTASQAAWLAAKGWLRRLAGYEEEAFAFFQRSREMDGDVAYGWLFEGMVSLSRYLSGQNLPPTTLTDVGIAFQGIPPETSEMRRERERFENLLARVSRLKVWGESSSKDFSEVLSGFQALQSRDFASAERGLSKAFGVPELLWLAGEIRLARAKIRYLSGSFSASLEDIDAVLELHPDRLEAHFFRASMLCGAGMALKGQGSDPRDEFLEAIRVYSDLMHRDPEWTSLYVNRAIACKSVGEVQAERGEDPCAMYRKSVRDLEEAIRLEPQHPLPYTNLGITFLALGMAGFRKGEDPQDFYKRALASLDESIRRSPEDPSNYVYRGIAYRNLGIAEAMGGIDPRQNFEKAIANLTEALRKRDGYLLALDNRGLVYVHLGRALADRGIDPRDRFLKAVADHEEVIRKNPDAPTPYTHRGIAYEALADTERSAEKREEWMKKAIGEFTETLHRNPESDLAYTCRGIALTKLGDCLARRKEDPREVFRKAIADLDEALRRNPKETNALINRGIAFQGIGMAEVSLGKDPRALYAKAVADQTEALGVNPNYLPAFLNRGTAHILHGNFLDSLGLDSRESYRNADRDCEEILRRHRDHFKGRFTRANANLHLGEAQANHGEEPWDAYRKSIEDLKILLQRIPHSWRVSHNMGIMLEKLGDFEEAAKAYKIVRQITEVNRAGVERQIARAKKAMHAPPWSRLRVRADLVFKSGAYTIAQKLYEEALEASRNAGATGDPESASVFIPLHRNLACAIAQRSIGKSSPKVRPKAVPPEDALRLKKEAVAHLQKAVNLGYRDLDALRKDPRLAPLRDLPEFETLMKTLEGKGD